jgi:DNA polymerase-3 subunit delta'
MWSTILGHKRQIDQLKRALSGGCLPNAYLFSGPSGIGKRLVADVFASAIFCADSHSACGKCVPCTKIKNRSHPDVFFIEPATEKILIDQVRELQQNLKYHPLESDAKLAIIDDADLMTEAAANSLLKILEEPPQVTHFILVSAFPHRLLPTIRSRCQKIIFSPLAEGEVVSYLMDKRGFDEKNARRIARISQGSIGAVALLDPEFIEEVLGRLKTLLKSANSSDVIATAEVWSKEGEKTTLIVDLIVSFYRDALYRQEAGSDTGLMHAEWASVLENQPAGTLEDKLRTAASARDALATAANKQLLFEQLLFTLTS